MKKWQGCNEQKKNKELEVKMYGKKRKTYF